MQSPSSTSRWIALAALAACGLTACSKSREPPPPPPDPKDIPANIDRIATKVLADTGVPSAVVAAVFDGKIAYVHAYGDARLEPKTAATPQMRYSIGSISKQFTAAALLLLAEDGKLSIDDKVARYVPGLTRGEDISIRQLLSHTSGYPDYAPQDYMVPEWEKPIDARQLTANASAYFTDAAIDEFAKTLEPLGAVQSLEQTSGTQRGGMAAWRRGATS